MSTTAASVSPSTLGTSTTPSCPPSVNSSNENSSPIPSKLKDIDAGTDGAGTDRNRAHVVVHERKMGPVAHLLIFTTVQLLVYFDRGILAQMLDKVGEQFDVTSYTQKGVLGGAFMLGYIVAAPLFALLAKRSQEWTVLSIVLGLVVWILASIFTCFLPQNYYLLVTVRALSGVGDAAFCALAPGIVDDSSPSEKKGFYLGLFFMSIYIGSAAGYLIAGFFKSWDTGKYLFLAEAVLMIPPTLFTFFKRFSFVVPQPQATGKAWHEIRQLLHIRTFAWMVLGYGSFMFVIGGFAFWGPVFLKDHWEMSDLSTGVGFGLATVLTGLFGTLIGGRLLDTKYVYKGTGEKKEDSSNTSVDKSLTGDVTRAWISARMAFYLVLISAFICSCIAWLPTGLWFFAVFSPAQFLLFGTTVPTNVSIMSAVPEILRGQAMALSISISHILGDCPAPLIIGVMRDHLPCNAVMAICLSLLFVNAFCWYKARQSAFTEFKRMKSDSSHGVL